MDEDGEEVGGGRVEEGRGGSRMADDGGGRQALSPALLSRVRRRRKSW